MPAVVRTALDGLLTPDKRYLVVRGRLWRATNPALDADERERWTKRLMDARRAVGKALQQEDEAGVRRARARVHRAKLALGERGPAWWEDGAPDYNRHLVANTPYRAWHERAVRWASQLDRLLGDRARGASVCPSEVARAAEAQDWRKYLDEVRAVARHLARQGAIQITQRGRAIDPDADVRGAIRLSRGPGDSLASEGGT